MLTPAALADDKADVDRVQVFGGTAVSSGFDTRSSVQNGQKVSNPAR